ncbi:MAG: Rpn family recombination-promoting nuclease/putative transposase [Rivularia sp. (in: cyanobacteria)]
MSYDNICKLIAEKYPLEFARWLLPVEPRQIKVLKTELSIEPIRADSLIFLQTENRILHIEFQTITTSTPSIPFRMLDYSVRLIRQYGIPVVQVVIFLQETNDEIAFTEEYVNETTTHRYRAIRMWEQDSMMFINNLALLPLAPLTKTTSPQTLWEQVKESIAKISDRETKKNTAAYVEILAGLKFEKDLIRKFLSEDIMQDSVIYQDIFQKGEKQGEKKGRQEEAFQFLTRQINRRFGEIDSSIIEKIRLLSTAQLETLGEEFIDFSDITDLITWLEQN